MDLRTLRYFVEVARHRSFTLAAEKLFVTQPTLSRQIADLEEELGQRLFERSTRHIELTEKGVYLFRQAENILSLVETTKRDVMQTEEVAGDLTIAAAEAPAVCAIAEVLEAFREAHPQVRSHLLSMNGHDALLSLKNGLAHFAIFNTPAVLHGFEYMRIPQLAVWGVLTRRDGPLAGKTFVTPDDLKDLPLYISRQNMLRSRFSGWLGFPFERLNIVGTYNLLYNVSHMVRAGGHALAITGIVEPDEELMFLPMKPLFQSEIVFAWSQAAPKRALTDLFLEAVRAKLAVMTEETLAAYEATHPVSQKPETAEATDGEAVKKTVE